MPVRTASRILRGAMISGRTAVICCSALANAARLAARSAIFSSRRLVRRQLRLSTNSAVKPAFCVVANNLSAGQTASIKPSSRARRASIGRPVKQHFQRRFDSHQPRQPLRAAGPGIDAQP